MLIPLSTRRRILVTLGLVLFWVVLAVVLAKNGTKEKTAATLAGVPLVLWVAGLVIRDHWVAAGQRDDDA